MWRDDIRVWQRELESAGAIVGQLTSTFNALQEILRTHLGAIQVNEQLPEAHEYVLTQQEKGCSGRVIMFDRCATRS